MTEQREPYTAELLGNGLVVWDSEEGSQLYDSGFYGKPVGIAKPKSIDFKVPLILGLIEGLYLLEKEMIRVHAEGRGKGMGVEDLREYAEKKYEGFNQHYVVYKDLRDRGYIVLPGIKFGCEYAIYKRGPGIDHSPYLVSVRGTEENITATDIVRAGRLATSVRKKFIVAVPNLRTGDIRYMLFNWFKA